MNQFKKQALTTDEQIDLLIRRGMHIDDRAQARHHLTHISYYRLRAYWLPFEQAASNSNEHAFAAGTNLATVLAIYEFDRELRLLLIDAIERVEISLRTRLANVLGLRYDPFAHEKPEHFADPSMWRGSRSELIKEYTHSREIFAEHYHTKYPDLPTPPLWVACELMTLGHLSRWLKNLRSHKDRQTIADAYHLDEKVLVSFAHHLSIVRNHCAHHGRLWNRKFTVKMAIPKKKPQELSSAFNPAQSSNLYNTLTMLAYLMDVISPASTWRQQLKKLIHDTPQISVINMGFPSDWEQRAIWRKNIA